MRHTSLPDSEPSPPPSMASGTTATSATCTISGLLPAYAPSLSPPVFLSLLPSNHSSQLLSASIVHIGPTLSSTGPSPTLSPPPPTHLEKRSLSAPPRHDRPRPALKPLLRLSRRSPPISRKRVSSPKPNGRSALTPVPASIVENKATSPPSARNGHNHVPVLHTQPQHPPALAPTSRPP